MTTPAYLLDVDHLVYGTPNLDDGVAEIEKLTGVRASPGGSHPGRGTRNALIALGPRSYLEIMGPDPDQPAQSGPRVFGIDDLKGSKLVAWYLKGRDLPRLRAEAVAQGVPLGDVKSGSRRRPDGVELSWHFTDPWVRVGDGVVPLFIDWGASLHPASGAVGGVSLVALRAEHPRPEAIRQMLQNLAVDLPLNRGETVELIATLETPHGRVEVR